MSDVNVTFEPEKVSVEALAHLGEGHIAYVKQVRSEDVPGLFPQAPKIAPGLKLFALHAADGTPMQERKLGGGMGSQGLLNKAQSNPWGSVAVGAGIATALYFASVFCHEKFRDPNDESQQRLNDNGELKPEKPNLIPRAFREGSPHRD